MDGMMQEGVRHYENASCRIKLCAALPKHMRSKTRELVNLDVPDNLRRTGLATQLLENVCDEADAHNITLILFPKPFGNVPGMSQSQLEAWYERRFGFIPIQQKPVMMARMPHSTPKMFIPNYISEALKGDKQ